MSRFGIRMGAGHNNGLPCDARSIHSLNTSPLLIFPQYHHDEQQDHDARIMQSLFAFVSEDLGDNSSNKIYDSQGCAGEG
eukprot:scaffold139318_cov18-Tisochrysis_lutea.AAC.1